MLSALNFVAIFNAVSWAVVAIKDLNILNLNKIQT